MNRRTAAFGAVLALSLAVPPALATSAAAASRPGTTRVTPTTGPGGALSRLRNAARGSLRVHLEPDGTVNHLASAKGTAVLPAPSGVDTPQEAVEHQLGRFGEAFGIDGTRSRAVVRRTIRSSTGGTVVRADQVVDGIPVFGGQVVTSLDHDNGVVSVDAATTDATTVPAAKVSQDKARRTAVAMVARNYHLPAASLQVSSLGERVFDPSLVGGAAPPLGARPVWQFQVGDGDRVRETVLVGAVKGEVALHFNQVSELNRSICDNGDAHVVSSDDDVPDCTAPARTEGGAPSSVADVNDAYDNLGAVSDAYQQLDGLNLTDIIGLETNGVKSLTATVRWCYSDACPYDDAFWDGQQMVFGDGYARADDVVGHELTHGYVQHTSGLFDLYQSGAINESVADTIGEVVDHRNNPAGPEDNSDWTIGEDLGDPAAERSMQDPPLHGQPDRTGSNLWSAKAVDFADPTTDDGDVHLDDGVGNKTAYLISQGGTFNGQTITGIDGTDDGLAKTGRLYLEAIPRLTSGADYAQLGNVLIATCQQLAAHGTGDFSSSDCDSVTAAVAATQLETAPAGAPAQAPITCPTGTAPRLVARDDDGIDGFTFSSNSPLWGRTDGYYVPSWASSGTSSLFALDPDPSIDDMPASGAMWSRALTVPRTTGGTFLNFHHTYLLDYDGGTYYDGGQVLVQKLVGGAWTTVNGLPWVNGANRHILGSTTAGFTGFGGDSHGYGSSQVDLTSLAGQTVRFVFRIEGSPNISFYGWWIDDVRMFSCALPVPSAPTAVGVRAAGSSVVVTWKPPTTAGSGVSGYVVSHGSVTKTVSGSTRTVTFTGLPTTTAQSFSVSATAPDLSQGPAASRVVYATASTLSSSKAKVKKRKPFVLTARVVRRGSSSPAAGVGVILQRKAGSAWANVISGTTGRSGTKAWTLRQSKSTYYRVLTRAGGIWFASASSPRLVRKK